MKAEKKIALLYFSRNAESEGRQKSWFPTGSANKNTALASSLILQTSNVLSQSGFPVFHFHEGNQQGQTFGERLANAYGEVFRLGYDAVIAVGNDTPDIHKINWQYVGRELASGKCVLGTSLRGGAYLIGITSEAFHKDQFQHLPWQSGRLFVALSKYCILTENDSLCLLESLRDINSWHDLKKLTKSLDSRHILKKLIRLLFISGNRPFQARANSFIDTILSLNLSLRAPPNSIFI